MLGTWDIRARVALLTASACVLAPAPAAAETRIGWLDHGAGLPAGAEVAALDAGPGLTVAAGRDADTGTALLAEDTGAGWTLIAAGLPAGATLVAVAVDGAEAWAVGSAGGAPVAVHRAPEGGWTPVAVPAGVAALTAVSLAPGTGAGYAGDAAGTLHAIGGGAITAGGLDVPGSDGVTGIALRGPVEGFVAAAPTALGAGGGIFRLTAGPAGPALQPMPATRSSTGLPPVSVAASAASGIAASGTHLWRLSADGASWSIDTSLPTAASSPPAALTAIDVAADGSEVVAGAWAGDGAVWRRVPAAGWLRDDAVSSGTPLTAVAVRGADDIDAAGRGTARRYGPFWVPDPEPEPTTEPEPEPDPEPEETATAEPEASPTPPADPADEETDGAAESSGQAADADPKSLASAADPEPAQMAPPAVVVSTPPAGKAAKPKTVLSDIRVARQPRRLVITFRLSARARVSFAAARGRRVVGRTSTKALRPGRWQVVLRYRGRRAPTGLKAVVRPVKKARSTRRVP